MDSNIILGQEQQFDEVINIILQHQSRASRAVNEETLLMAWNVGGYVSNQSWKDIAEEVYIIWCSSTKSILPKTSYL